MKTLLNFFVVTLLNGAFLYPLWFSGVGKPISWVLEIFMATGGIFCFYLLVKYRKQL